MKKALNKARVKWTIKELSAIIKACDKSTSSNPSCEISALKAATGVLLLQNITWKNFSKVLKENLPTGSARDFFIRVTEILFVDFKKLPLYVNSHYTSTQLILAHRLKRGY